MLIFIKKKSAKKGSTAMEPCAEIKQNDLLALAKGGDEAAFEALLETYSPLIESLISGFSLTDLALDIRDDLRQEACIAFFGAVKSFDAAQSEIRFGLFAKICIRNRLISYQRKLNRLPRPAAEDALALSEEEADPARAVVEKENYLALYSRINDLLSPYEKQVWWMYLSGRTAREIGDAIGRDERSVQNAVYRIRQKLRRAIPSP